MKIWAVTSYFNPFGCEYRLRNYHRFDPRRIGLPLLTVELACPGSKFDLEPSSADLLVQVRGDCMWQKERLVNEAVARLPDDCDYVVVIDCDILPPSRDWPQQIVDALEKSSVVQPYTKIDYLNRQGEVELSRVSRVSVGGYEAGAEHFPPNGPSAGIAWAFRREFLQRHGLYEFCIVGGGDSALACAVFGCPERCAALHKMNTFQTEQYFKWASEITREATSVGSVDRSVTHLWHGDLASRNYKDRHAILSESFDPARDIRQNDDGAFVWATDKPQLHVAVRDYFKARNAEA